MSEYIDAAMELQAHVACTTTDVVWVEIHIESSVYVEVCIENDPYIKLHQASHFDGPIAVRGSLKAALAALTGVEYDRRSRGWGSRRVSGTIWYQDGTWSERAEHEGCEWWMRKVCPRLRKRG